MLDPFSGSSTTGIAANLLGRKFVGIEKEEEFCDLSARRREEMEDEMVRKDWMNHIPDIRILQSLRTKDAPTTKLGF